MRTNLCLPHVEGEASRQAHADVPADTFEREVGREGFFGAATHLYHRNPPTAWSSIEGPLRPRAFAPMGALPTVNSPWQAREMFFNAAVRIRVARLAASMNTLVRNADGDDLVFVHAGEAEWFSDYGRLQVRAGDYLVIPRGCMWRFQGEGTLDLLIIQATGAAYGLPERGILGKHAPFDLGVMDKPAIDDAFRAQSARRSWDVQVKRQGRVSVVRYPYNPLDVVGWKGDLYPVRLNIRDIRAIVSDRLHLPPSLRTTFVAPRFVVCSLVPRPLETDPRAMKLPFFHSNDDYDEVIFQHFGTHGSRGAGMGPGSFSLHPSGVIHGPHPEVLPYMFDHPARETVSYSVMVDTRDPLEVAEVDDCELPAYADSWKASIEFAPDAAPEERT
jgi:homogentisate 1,2-dioxygenase